MENENEFILAMSEEFEDVYDLVDALWVAMEEVQHHVNDNRVIYFGAIGDGVFYSASSIEQTRWYPETTISEALNNLLWDLGEEAVENLTSY